MTLPSWFKPAAIVVGLIVLALTFTCYGRASERAKESARLLAESRDSVKGLHDSLSVARQDLRLARAKIDTFWRVRTVYLTHADSAHRRADSLIILAAVDSVAACRLVREAYDARTNECAELRKVVAVQDTSIRLANATLLLTEDRLTEAVSTSAALSAKLKLVSKPYVCRILFLPCPGRTTMFVVGALGGAAGMYALNQK